MKSSEPRFSLDTLKSNDTHTPSDMEKAETDQSPIDHRQVEQYEESAPVDAEKVYTPSLLTKTLSRRSAASSWIDPGPPPEGGSQAWLQVLALHLTVFSTWGWITSYGVFQSYYSTTLGLQPSAISWLGSVQVFLLFFLGSFSGRATDAGLFRVVFVLGTCFQLLGVFAMSASTQYWQLFLSQALATGISNGLQFCPSMALVSTYFVKKRPFALGLGALGSCTGGIIFPIIVQQLLPRIGFGWTIRTCGFIMLLTNAVAILLYRVRLPPRKSGALVEWSAFRELPFTLFALGMFFNFWGLYFAFYFVGAFGRNVLGISYEASINLLLAMVAIGLPFRLIPNYFAVALGPLNVLMPFTLLCGIMMFAWTGVHSVGGLYVFAILYGAGSAVMQSMFPPSLASLTDDLKKAGARMGMGFSVVSFACLSGPPIAGALIQANNGDYLYAQIWAGTSFFVGTSLLFAARSAKVGLKLRANI